MKHLFSLSVLMFCALELFNAHLMDSMNVLAWANLVISELALIALAGALARTNRHKTVLQIIAVWMCWILVTDWVPYFPAWLATYESTLFTVIIGMVLTRPEHLPSYLGPNVSIALYSGPSAPKIARMLSWFGLPFYGVALVVDGKMMMPRRSVGKYVKVDLPNVPRRWTILGTPHETTDEIKALFNNLEGTPVKGLNCVSAIRPALEILGYHSKTPGGLAMEVLNGGRL